MRIAQREAGSAYQVREIDFGGGICDFGRLEQELVFAFHVQRHIGLHRLQ